MIKYRANDLRSRGVARGYRIWWTGETPDGEVAGGWRRIAFNAWVADFGGCCRLLNNVGWRRPVILRVEEGWWYDYGTGLIAPHEVCC